MRIFVDSGAYGLRNIGDVAMLQVALERLRELWPQARLDVVAYDAEMLRHVCPYASWVPAHGRGQFLGNGALLGPLWPRLPGAEASGRARAPRAALNWIALRKRLRARPTRELRAYGAALLGADLVISSGGGFLADAFAAHSRGVLENLWIAKRLGKPTAMLGQGIGPARGEVLATALRRFLPALDLLSLRESLESLSIVREMGFPTEKTLVTGDDAIELAFGARSETLGEHLGFNVRVTNYAGMTAHSARPLFDQARQFADNKNADIVPLPISHHGQSSDVVHLAHLLGGDGGASLDSPALVASQVARCRLVVTGSYHAGVFALSQGLPIIGLSNSDYYDAKFAGLHNQFGGGVGVVRTDAPDWSARYADALEQSWEAAPRERAALLEAAGRQIALSREAYGRLPALVESQKP